MRWLSPAPASLGDQPQALFFFKNLAITGGLMAIVGAGAGTWSVDGKLGK